MIANDHTPSRGSRLIAVPNRAVTGRDGFIIVMGLVCAIAAMQSLPMDLWDASDCSDMKLLLRAFVPTEHDRDPFADNVCNHFGRRPDLKPWSDGA